MVKRILSIALAYVGIIVGAGLSSGQDLMQYFVGFGIWGMIGVIVLGLWTYYRDIRKLLSFE